MCPHSLSWLRYCYEIWRQETKDVTIAWCEHVSILRTVQVFITSVTDRRTDKNGL